MASTIRNSIIIDVKNGDVFDETRLSNTEGKKGKSNTGTYFLCSAKDYSKYSIFFNKYQVFRIDKNKIEEYRIVFKKMQYKNRAKYSDRMVNFDVFCDYIMQSENTKVDIDFRVNDTRYFFKFKNNKDEVVNAFRHILYGKITSICLEFRKQYCAIYPVIKYQETLFLD